MLYKKGFTLVELLIVIAILAILSTLGISNFQTAKIKARDAGRKSDLATVAKALEAYVNDHRAYPLSNSSGQIICRTGNVACDWDSAFTDGTTIYVSDLPHDSNVNQDYIYESATGADYTLYARLENTNDPNIASPALTKACGGVICNYKISSSNK